MIDTFQVNDDGTVGMPIANESATPLPFGFEFDSQNRLVMSEVTRLDGPGTLSTYDLDIATGELQWFLSVSTQGLAPCWVSITADDGHAFLANTAGAGAPLPPSVTTFELGPFSQPIFNQVGEPTPTPTCRRPISVSAMTTSTSTCWLRLWCPTAATRA